MYEATLRSQDTLEDILYSLYHDFSQQDPSSITRLTGKVLDSLPNVLDSVLMLYENRASQPTQNFLKGALRLKKDELRNEDRIYNLLSPFSRTSIFKVVVENSRNRREDYKLELDYLPVHSKFYLLAPEGTQYAQQFLYLFKNRIQTLIGQGFILVNSFEYFTLRFLSFLVRLANFTDLERNPPYRNIYHKLFNEYLQWFSDNSRAGNMEAQSNNASKKMFFHYMSEEYLIFPVINFSQGLTRQVKNEIVSRICPNQMLYVSDLFYHKAQDFLKEKIGTGPDAFSINRTKENWWEVGFKDFVLRTHQFCCLLMQERDFQNAVSYGDIFGLSTTLLDPLNRFGSDINPANQSISDRAFNELYVKYTAYYVTNLLHLIIFATSRDLAFVDDFDLRLLNTFLGYFVPETNKGSSSSGAVTIYHGKIERQKFLSWVEAGKTDQKTLARLNKVQGAYNLNDNVRSQAASLADEIELKTAGNPSPVPERIRLIFDVNRQTIQDKTVFRRTTSCLFKQNEALKNQRSAFSEDCLEWSDCIRPGESIIFYILALLLGHIADFWKFKIMGDIELKAEKKTVYRKGQLVEYQDKWSKFYPRTNLRKLAQIRIWLLIAVIITLTYLAFNIHS